MSLRIRLPVSPLRGARCGVSAFAVACLAALPGSALGQGTGTIRGTVVDRERRVPVEGARIVVLGTGPNTLTDSGGRFELVGVPSGLRVVQARAVGYSVGSWLIQLDEGQVFRDEFGLEARAVELEPVTVTGREDRTGWRSEAGFEQRRREGRGFFFTREEIARRRPETITDLLRSVPGVQTACRGLAGCRVQMARSTRLCSPEYFLDGFPATFATGPNFPINQIRGVEVYRSEFETPSEFQRPNLRCGVIAIWTIEPGENLDRRP